MQIPRAVEFLRFHNLPIAMTDERFSVRTNGIHDPEAQLSIRCRQFLLTGVEPGHAVLDVGCGDGDLMRELQRRGCRASGVEISSQLVAHCRAGGLDVVEGLAEKLPFPDGQFDGIVCSVVLPYTDERRAVAEFARVLKRGGYANVTGHGLGYAFDMLASDWREKLYGARMLISTGWKRITGTRLPGLLGDTVCELAGPMRQMAAAAGMHLEQEEFIGTCCGAPRFLAQRFRKPADALPAAATR